MKIIKIGIITIISLIFLFFAGFSFMFFTEYLPKFKKLNINIDAKTFFKYRWFGGGYKNLSLEEFKHFIKTHNNYILVDLRKKEEYNQFHLNNAISAPFNYLIVNQTIKFNKNKVIILTCYHGNMSRVAGSILNERGYKNIFSLNGSIKEFKNDK